MPEWSDAKIRQSYSTFQQYYLSPEDLRYVSVLSRPPPPPPPPPPLPLTSPPLPPSLPLPILTPTTAVVP